MGQGRITHPKLDALPQAEALGVAPQVVQEQGVGQEHGEVLREGEVGEGRHLLGGVADERGVHARPAGLDVLLPRHPGCISAVP